MNQNRTPTHFLALLASVVVVACCSTSPLLQVTAIKKPSLMIIERHDQYVMADASLIQEDVDKYLAESASLKSLLITKLEVRQSAIKPLAIPICVRHDEYVGSDGELDDLHRRTFLRSSKILLEVIAAGQ
jgi:hypothetical protein